MLKWTNFFGVCVPSPTALMRREVVEKLHFCRPELLYASDVDLWMRASAITEFCNVPELLYQYRLWDGSSTQRHLQTVRATHVQLLTSYIADFLKVRPAMEAVSGLRQTRVGPPPRDLRQIVLTAALIRNLYERFVQENNLTISDNNQISWDAAKRIASLAIHASRLDRGTSLSLAMQALMLDCRLLSPAVVMKGWEYARAVAAP
jgi:hypothetical protein